MEWYHAILPENTFRLFILIHWMYILECTDKVHQQIRIVHSISILPLQHCTFMCSFCGCCCRYHWKRFRFIFNIIHRYFNHFDQLNRIFQKYISQYKLFPLAYFCICRVNFKWMEITCLDMHSVSIIVFFFWFHF